MRRNQLSAIIDRGAAIRPGAGIDRLATIKHRAAIHLGAVFKAGLAIETATSLFSPHATKALLNAEFGDDVPNRFDRALIYFANASTPSGWKRTSTSKLSL
jgi:hypothetical protein